MSSRKKQNGRSDNLKQHLDRAKLDLTKQTFPINVEAYKNDPEFYEELALLKAQEAIAELMQNTNTSKTKLAKLLKQPKAHVTELLSDGQHLTLKTLARICFYLKSEINFNTAAIGAKKTPPANTHNLHLKGNNTRTRIHKTPKK